MKRRWFSPNRVCSNCIVLNMLLCLRQVRDPFAYIATWTSDAIIELREFTWLLV